jgi:hypothetical protein
MSLRPALEDVLVDTTQPLYYLWTLLVSNKKENVSISVLVLSSRKTVLVGVCSIVLNFSTLILCFIDVYLIVMVNEDNTLIILLINVWEHVLLCLIYLLITQLIPV